MKKESPFPFVRRRGGPQSRDGLDDEDKMFSFLRLELLVSSLSALKLFFMQIEST
jgi:hypothetical protein